MTDGAGGGDAGDGCDNHDGSRSHQLSSCYMPDSMQNVFNALSQLNIIIVYAFSHI